MVPAGLYLDQVISILRANGYNLLSDLHWEEKDVERYIFGKDGHTFVIRAKVFFPYPEVAKRLFDMLKVTNIPTDCQEDYSACITAYHQHLAMRQRSLKEEQRQKSQPTDQIDNKDKEEDD